MTSFKSLPAAIAIGVSISISVLSGCSASFNPVLSGGIAQTGGTVAGKVMGGQQPILGAHIFLFATGSGGYGSPSSSLLQAPGTVINTHTVSNTAQDANGDYYVATSNTDGSFDITNDYTCPQQNSQIYLVSEGGNPGAGANSAAVLMLAAGTCGNLTASTFLLMNELTTVAAVTSLQQFIVDPLHIGTSSANQLGLQHAFLTAQYLVNINNGVPSTGTTTSVGTVTFPSAKVYTLGDALGGCVNSVGPSSNGCTSLFTGAGNDPNTGNPPTDTFQAMLLIARSPASDPVDVINAIPPQSAFGNALTTVNDFSLAISYTGGGLASATGLAIDGNGDVWVANCGLSCDPNTQQQDSLVKVTPYGDFSQGLIATGAHGVGLGTLEFPQAIAVDQNNYVWATNITPSVAIFQPNGTQIAGSPFTAPVSHPSYLTGPEGLAIDTTGVAWIANSGTGNNSNVASMSTNGSFGQDLTNASVVQAVDVAMDFNQPFGNIVVSDETSGIIIFKPVANSHTYDGGTALNIGAPNPTAIALDAGHNIWEVDPGDSAIYKLTLFGTTYASSAAITPTGAQQVQGLGIDGVSSVLVPNCAGTCGGSGNDSLLFVDNSGAVISGRNGITDDSLSNPVAVGMDASGNAWVANAATGAVTEFIGIAAPVQTPLVAAVANQTVGSRP